MSRLYVVVLVVLSATSAQGGDRIFVRSLGDPQTFTFEGVKSFDEPSIREALLGDLEFRAAAHPKAKFKPFLAAVRERVLNGYLARGFRDASVNVECVNDERIAISVVEGRRYTCGAFKLTAVAGIDLAALEGWLKPEPLEPGQDGKPVRKQTVSVDSEESTEDEWSEKPEQLSFWQSGKPVMFHPVANRLIKREVQRALQQQGRYLAEVGVDFVPQPDGLADLIIDVTDAGPRARLGTIVLKGFERNARDPVLKFLELREGMEFEPKVLSRVNERLKRCGRFLHVDAKVEPASSAKNSGQDMTLTILVRETPGASLVGEAHTPIERICLKSADWLSHWAERDEDLVVECTAELESAYAPIELTSGGTKELIPVRFRFAASPRDGLSGELEFGGDRRFSWGFLLTAQQSLMISDRLKQCWTRRFSADARVKSQAILKFQLKGEPDSSSELYVHNYFGLSVKGLKDDEALCPIHAKFTCEPAYLLCIATMEGARATLLNNTLKIADDDGWVWHIDAETGQLQVIVDNEHASCKIEFRKGTFEERKHKLQRKAAEYRDVCSQGRELISLVEFIGAESSAWFRQTDVEGSIVAARIGTRIAERLFTRWRSYAAAEAESDADRTFVIIDRPDDVANNLVLLALRVNDGAVARDTWLHVLNRELAFILKGHPEFAQDELTRLLESQSTGPLGHLYISEMLCKWVSPDAGRVFAAKGLTRLDSEAFRSDCKSLLEPDGVCELLGAELTAALSDCTADELRSLAKLLAKAEHQERIHRTLLRFRDHKPAAAAPADELLPPHPHQLLIDALSELWDLEWRDPVRSWLQYLSEAGLVKPA